MKLGTSGYNKALSRPAFNLECLRAWIASIACSKSMCWCDRTASASNSPEDASDGTKQMAILQQAASAVPTFKSTTFKSDPKVVTTIRHIYNAVVACFTRVTGPNWVCVGR